MNQNELKKKLEALQKQITEIINSLDEDKKESKAFEKAIDRRTSDDQYVVALRELKNLPFKLSAKQFAWILAFTRYHQECDQDIISFVKSQLKRDNMNEFIDQVAATLRKSYTNDYNQDFIQKVIITLIDLTQEI